MPPSTGSRHEAMPLSSYTSKEKDGDTISLVLANNMMSDQDLVGIASSRLTTDTIEHIDSDASTAIAVESWQCIKISQDKPSKAWLAHCLTKQDPLFPGSFQRKAWEPGRSISKTTGANATTHPYIFESLRRATPAEISQSSKVYGARIVVLRVKMPQQRRSHINTCPEFSIYSGHSEHETSNRTSEASGAQLSDRL